MSESKTKTRQNEQISEEQIREVLNHWSIPHSDLNYAVNDDPDDIPYLVLGHEAYFGVEAHLFTAADMALWIPELLPTGDVVIYFPIRTLDPESAVTLSQRRMLAWEFLMRSIDWVIHKVRKGRAEHGGPSESWAHCEREEDGYFEIPENHPIPIDKILSWVDPSITEVILELNIQGFVTVESCSGLREDHEGKRPFNAYVCFDDEYYHDVSAHLFTLAEAAGWDPTFGAHGFDVMFHCKTDDESGIAEAWDRLEEMATEFGEYLESYRGLVEPHQGYFYYRFRKERALFSRFYSEEFKSLNGFSEELDGIEKEFDKE